MKAAYIAPAIFVAMIAGCSSQNTAAAKAEAEAAKFAEAEAAKAAQANGLGDIRRVLGNSFNARDAKLVAGFYAEDAELIHLTGETVKGRAAIEKQFADWFAADLRVTATMTNQRFVTPDVLLEDGIWDSNASKKGFPDRGRYMILMVYRDGQWRVVSHRSWAPIEQPEK